MERKSNCAVQPPEIIVVGISSDGKYRIYDREYDGIIVNKQLNIHKLGRPADGSYEKWDI